MFLAFLQVKNAVFITRHSAYAIVYSFCCFLCLTFFFVSYCQCKLLSKVFVATEKKKLQREVFLYFLDNDMNLWVEFWKFVSKCFQVFTWPYVYISMTFQKGMYSNSIQNCCK